MTQAPDLPAWAALVVAVLLLLGAGTTLVGSLGLLRLKTFYERVHAPTLGTTLGTALIARGVPLEKLVLVEYDASFCKLLERRFPGAHILRGDAYRRLRA